MNRCLHLLVPPSLPLLPPLLLFLPPPPLVASSFLGPSKMAPCAIVACGVPQVFLFVLFLVSAFYWYDFHGFSSPSTTTTPTTLAIANLPHSTYTGTNVKPPPLCSSLHNQYQSKHILAITCLNSKLRFC
jgi:hypothetical protein